MFVGHSTSDKIDQISHRVFTMRAGTSAHSKYITHILKTYTEMQSNELGNFVPVKSVTHLASKILYENRPHLNSSIILAGWDPYLGYQINHINQVGFVNEGQDYAMSGSGSTFLVSYVDANYKPGMSKAEIKEFLKSCVSLACYRDGSSGGCIRILDITKEGTKKEFINYGDFLIK